MPVPSPRLRASTALLAVGFTCGAAAHARGALIADFGDPATNPESNVTGAAVYGGTISGDVLVGTGFLGANLPSAAVSEDDRLVLRARRIDGDNNVAQIELFDTDYALRLDIPFDTSLLGSEFADVDLGVLSSFAVPDGFNFGDLDGFQITSLDATIEIDLVETRPVPEPASLAVLAAAAAMAVGRVRRRA